jgi:hypothetical protein
MCSVVVQRRDETFCVLDEIVIPRASTIDACEEFMTRFGFHAAGLIVYGDASGNNLKTTGTTDYEMMRRFFRNTPYRVLDYRIPTANPLVRDRVLTMNATLKSADGRVRLKIASKCAELIKDLEEVVFKPGTTAIDKDKDPKRTHLSDALGYLVWAETRSTAKNGEQPRRLL